MRLPIKKFPPKKYPKNTKYTIIYTGLPEDALKTLRKYSRKQHSSQSKVVQEAIDYYLIMWERGDPIFDPLKKKQMLGFKRIARTIEVEQDKKLRFLAEQMGRSISELVREAVIGFLKMRKMLD